MAHRAECLFSNTKSHSNTYSPRQLILIYLLSCCVTQEFESSTAHPPPGHDPRKGWADILDWLRDRDFRSPCWIPSKKNNSCRAEAEHRVSRGRFSAQLAGAVELVADWQEACQLPDSVGKQDPDVSLNITPDTRQSLRVFLDGSN